MGRVRISGLQMATILANLVFGKAIGYTSEVLVRAVGNDAWISMALAFAQGLPIIALMVWLVKRMGGETPELFLKRLLGRWLGRVVLMLLGVFFLGAFITSAITISQHVNDYLMTETPLLVFVVIYTLVCMYGVHLGLEVSARLSVLGLVLVAVLNVLVIAGTINHIDLQRLRPLLDQGIGPVVGASLLAGQDVAMATAAALFLLPATRPGKWLRVCLWGLGLGALLTLVWPIFEIGVLGADLTARYLIACMQLARAAQLGIFLHRYEMLMVVLFVYSVFTQSIVCLYGCVELAGAALSVGKRGRPWLILGIGVVSMVIHYLLAFDRQTYAHFLAYEWPWIAVPLGWGLPLLLCLVALLRPGLRRAGNGHTVGETL